MLRYPALYFSEFETILLKQEVNWAWIGRSEKIKEHLNDFWMSCVRSVYVVCPEGMILMDIILQIFLFTQKQQTQLYSFILWKMF